MIVFLLYVAFFCALAVYDAKHAKTVRGFFVNDNRSGSIQVGFSLIASCVGGSATIGMCGLAWKVGLPAIWWLASGAIGLAFLTLTLARRICRTRALTMPEMVKTHLGRYAMPVMVFVIWVAWISILAAQFSAMSRIVSGLTDWPLQRSLVAGAVFITFYTLLGGQTSVLRSDVVQFLVLLLGLVILLAWVCFHAPVAVWENSDWRLLNDRFTLSRWTYFMLLMGGSYVVCPMLFSRFLSARSEACAFRAGWLSVFGLLLTALVIVLIGIGATGILPSGDGSGDAVLMTLIGRMPAVFRVFLALAMMSAIVSSADSCLLAVSTVLSNDFLKRPALSVTRACIFVVSVFAFCLCCMGRDILGYLLMANNIYVCGVVAPVFIAFCFRRKLQPVLAAASICVGGILGLASELIGNPIYSYCGIAASILLAVAAAFSGSHEPDPVPPDRLDSAFGKE